MVWRTPIPEVCGLLDPPMPTRHLIRARRVPSSNRTGLAHDLGHWAAARNVAPEGFSIDKKTRS